MFLKKKKSDMGHKD